MGRQSYKQKWRTFSTYLSYKHLGDTWLQRVLEGKEDVNARHPMICNGATALDIVLFKASDRDPRAVNLLDQVLALGADPQLCDVWCHLLECPISSSFDAFPYVRKLLAVGVHPDKRGRKARTALHFLFNGYQQRVPELLDLFLSHGATVNARDVAGRVPLRFFLKKKTHKSITLLQRLLSAGANPNAQDIYMDTPLHVFCGYLGSYADVLTEKQYADWMQMLLKNGANPFLRGSQQQNVLELVVAAGQAETLQVLLKSSHDISVAKSVDGGCGPSSKQQGAKWAINDALADAVAAFLPRTANWSLFTGGCRSSKSHLEREMFVRQVHVIELLRQYGGVLSPAVRAELAKQGSPEKLHSSDAIMSLVVDRAAWAPDTHCLYPETFREAVRDLLLVAHRLAQRPILSASNATSDGAHGPTPTAMYGLGLVNNDILLRIIADMAYPLTSWLTIH